MSESPNSDKQSGASEETKEKFRQALEKKNAATHGGMPAEHEAKISHAHGSESSVHEFRRKSG